jgi:xanthine dehydrogenase YagR molybdenum-binding subunit
MTLALDVRGQDGHHHRGPREGDELHPVQQGVRRARRAPVRLLHAGHGHELCGARGPGRGKCTEDDVKGAIAGHLCRCGTYPNIFKAMAAVRAGGGCGARRGGRTTATSRRKGGCVMAAAEEAQEAESASPSQGAAHGKARGASREAPARARPNPGPAREQAVPVGIVGEGELRQVVRRVPLAEPPPLPENAKLSSIGKSIPRLDARQKVTGRAAYTFDVQLPGMLFGRRVVSPHPHARVWPSTRRPPSGTRASGRARAGAHARHGPPARRQGEQRRYPIVRYAGQPVAAVAATSQRAADEAARLVKVTYEPLPHVTELEPAMAETSPGRLPGPDRAPAHRRRRRRPARAAAEGQHPRPQHRRPRRRAARRRRQGDRRLRRRRRGRVRTQVQTHVPMETHGLVADWQDELVTVYASTQFTGSVRDEVAEHFDLPKSRIRVISEFTGAASARSTASATTGCSRCTSRARPARPCASASTARRSTSPAATARARSSACGSGSENDGTLTASTWSSYGTGGVATGAGIGFCTRACTRARTSASSSSTCHQQRPRRRVPRAQGRCRASSRSSSASTRWPSG